MLKFEEFDRVTGKKLIRCVYICYVYLCVCVCVHERELVITYNQ